MCVHFRFPLSKESIQVPSSCWSARCKCIFGSRLEKWVRDFLNTPTRMSTKMRSRWSPPIPRVPGIQCRNLKRSDISSRESRVVRRSINGQGSFNMMLLIEPGVTTGFNRLVIFTGPGPSDRLDDYVFKVPETCYRVAVIGDKFGLRHRETRVKQPFV